MENVLIDSSVWIHYFRQDKSPIVEHVNVLLDQDRVVLCGIVELEILQGLRAKESARIQELFEALSYIDTERDDFIAAGKMLNQLRSKGVTMAASDCLI